MELNSLERCPTGIDELDEVLGGGFVRNSVILLAGNPGTGKTVFAAKFIYEGIRRYNEPGVYLSFVESKQDFYRFMKSLGMDFESLERDGKFIFIEALTLADESTIDRTMDVLFNRVVDIKAKRAVIDSVTTMTQMMESASRARSLLQNAIVRGFKPFGVTVLLIADLPFGENKVGFGVEEFVVDGVIVFRMGKERGIITRYMEIRKMRGVDVLNVELPFIVIPSKGIQIMKLERPPVQPLVTEEKIETGIDYLDTMLFGGLQRGAQVLLVGPSGSGKSIMVANIVAHAISKGFRVVYASFEEPSAQIINRIRILGAPTSEEFLKVFSLNPTAYTFVEVLSRLMTLIDSYKPDIVVVDGLTALAKLQEPSSFWYYCVNIFLALKKRGIVGIHTYAANYPEEPVPLDTLADIVMVIKYTYKNEVKRKFTIWKSRLCSSVPKPVAMSISPKGRVELTEVTML